MKSRLSFLLILFFLISPFLPAQPQSQPQPDGDYSQVKEINEFLKDAITARQKAVEAGAEEFGLEFFSDGENRLQSAADSYRQGNSGRALQLSKEAEKLYRRAEFQSIRNSLLGQIRIMVQEAKDLRAEELAPKTYQHTTKLLAGVEALVEKNRFNDLQLSQKSRELYASAKHLLYVARMANFISAAAGNAETVILNLEEELISLLEQLNRTPSATQRVDELLARLQLSAKDLVLERDRLEMRNQQLELERRALEGELLTYKSLSDQRAFLEKKINQVSALVEGNAEIQGQFLILKIAPFAFNDEGVEISSVDPAQLARLMEALQEFYGYPLLIRYVQLSNGMPAYHQVRVNRRAEAIKEYIRSHLLFQDTPIQSAGVVYAPEHSASYSEPFLEIRIDLGSFPGLEQHTSGPEG